MLLDMNPFVRYVGRVKVGLLHVRDRVASDCRVFYCLQGQGKLIVEDIEYELLVGDCVFVPAGKRYRFLMSRLDLTLVAINFDFDLSRRELVQTLPKTDKLDDIVKPYLPEPFLKPIFFDGREDLSKEMDELVALFFYKEDDYQAFASALLKTLLLKMRKAPNSSVGKANVEKVLQYVRETYRERLKNEEIAKSFNYHPNHLNKIVKAYTGFSLKEYIIRYRLNVAKNLLLSMDVTITEISEDCGFSSPSYFAELFLKNEGTTPRAYREKMRGRIV